MNDNPQCTNGSQEGSCKDPEPDQVQQRRALAEDIALLVVRQYRRMSHPGGQPTDSADEPTSRDDS